MNLIELDENDILVIRGWDNLDQETASKLKTAVQCRAILLVPAGTELDKGTVEDLIADLQAIVEKVPEVIGWNGNISE